MDTFKPGVARGQFFKVLATTDKSQVATMTLQPGGDSGTGDKHAGDQIVYVISGTARVVVSGEEVPVHAGEGAVIPSGAPHHIYNDGANELLILNIYSSPEY